MTRIGGAAMRRELGMAFNHSSSLSGYQIGFGRSWDRQTWTSYLGKIPLGSGWDANTVKDPWLVWDGSQFVCFYSGYDNTRFAIGRATAPSLGGTWTKYASNPVLSHGGVGSVDEVGCEFPVVSYNANDSPAWKMWYIGQPSGWTSANGYPGTLCFADSTDGISWTKRGQVVGLGSAGAFNDLALFPGCFFRSASNNWTVYVLGFHNNGTVVVGMGGYCTCTDPANSATYSAVTQFANYTGNLTIGGRTWQSNMPRGIIAEGDVYRVFLSFWNPTVTTTIRETCGTAISPDLTSWPVPRDLMLTLNVSSENPSVIEMP